MHGSSAACLRRTRATSGRALQFAREIRTGVVKVNLETAGFEFQAPLWRYAGQLEQVA